MCLWLYKHVHTENVYRKEKKVISGREGKFLFNDTMVSITDIRCHERHHLSDHLTISRWDTAQKV